MYVNEIVAELLLGIVTVLEYKFLIVIVPEDVNVPPKHAEP